MQLDSSKEYHNSADIRFEAILTGNEQVPKIDTYNAGLAIFQSKGTINNDLKFSIKIASMDKIKKGCLHIGKPYKNGEVVPELYKTKTKTHQGKEVMGDLCHGKLNSYDLRGPLQVKKN